MYTRLLLSLLALALGSCAPRTLKLDSLPTAWDFQEPDASPRWVVAYPGSHGSALAPLKQTRSKQGYEVISIVAATPKKVQERVSTLRLGTRKDDCLLLVGTTKLLPGPQGIHHRMKGKHSDARYAMKANGSTPLFAVGRLPAASPKQCRMLVAKILSFERERQGAEKNNRKAVLLVGDPIGGSERMWAADYLVSSISRSLIRKADTSWTFTGAADVPGHPFASSTEEFPQKLKALLNQPYAVGAYFGHSNSEFLCRTSGGTGTIEGIFRNSFGRESWDRLSPSNQRGLFLSCGCYCLNGDDAVGYRSVTAPGGPVAFIGATRESYSAIGLLAAKGAVKVMDEHPPKIIGNWLLAVQKAIATEPMSRTLFFAFDKVDGSDGELTLLEQRREHLEMWMLVGDPATRLF